MNIAIIPARGGSKRIPRKNVKNFNGKPIIAYSIEAALNSKLFDKVIVSTDDEEIAEVSKEYGADIPFIRPKEISDDYATTNDVMMHAIRGYLEKNITISSLCCIYATAPFLQADDLVKAKQILTDDIDFVFSATEFVYPIFRSFKLKDDNRVRMFWPENFAKRSQDLEKAYHDAGMFYFGKPEAFLENKIFFAEYSKAFIIPHYRVQDIDTNDDWIRAENYYHALKVSQLI